MWNKRFVEYLQDNVARLSVAFTWHLPQVYQRAVWLRMEGYKVIAGGPAVNLMPDYLRPVAEIGDQWHDAISYHNPNATFTSRGCIRRCSFCAVPKTEGSLYELTDWPVRPIVCDNNLLATSKKHFNSVIDKLKPLNGIDFNQGLDARILTQNHASRLSELDCRVRLAFDHIKTENEFLSAYQKLRKAGVAKSRISVYVLIGYKDTIEDAHYRLNLIRELGSYPNPMRYHPLDEFTPNSFVGKNWTNRELVRTMRYWCNLRFFGGIPFAEFTG